MATTGLHKDRFRFEGERGHAVIEPKMRRMEITGRGVPTDTVLEQIGWDVTIQGRRHDGLVFAHETATVTNLASAFALVQIALGPDGYEEVD
jgi:hypothetical protein